MSLNPDSAEVSRILRDAIVGLMNATSNEAFAEIKDRETDLAFHTNLGRAWGKARSALNWLPAGDAS